MTRFELILLLTATSALFFALGHSYQPAEAPVLIKTPVFSDSCYKEPGHTEIVAHNVWQVTVNALKPVPLRKKQ